MLINEHNATWYPTTWYPTTWYPLFLSHCFGMHFRTGDLHAELQRQISHSSHAYWNQMVWLTHLISIIQYALCKSTVSSTLMLKGFSTYHPQSVPPCHIDYSELKAPEKHQVQEEISDLPFLPQRRSYNFPWKKFFPCTREESDNILMVRVNAKKGVGTWINKSTAITLTFN